MHNILLFPINVCRYFYLGIKTTGQSVTKLFNQNNKVNTDVPEVEEIKNDETLIEPTDIETTPVDENNEIVLPTEENEEVNTESETQEDSSEEPVDSKEQTEEIIEETTEEEIDNINFGADDDGKIVTLDPKKAKELSKLLKTEQIRLKKEFERKNRDLDEEERLKHKEDVKAAKIDLKKRMNDSYVNKDAKIEKPTHSFFTRVKKPKKSLFGSHNLSKDYLKKEALLINFDGADAEKSDVKILFEYVAKNPEGVVVKDYFEAFSKVEVHSFLLSEGYEVYSIRTNKWIQFAHKNANINNTKIKTKDLVFFITQLSTYIKAGIPLVEALRILERQYKNPKYKKIFKSVIYDLTMGENFSEALMKQNVAFPKLLINMVKTAEMTGELPEVLDDMAEYYSESEKTRKQMITALMYPSLVFVFATGVIIFILIYVVPQFVEIYASMDASSIPAFTRIVINVSAFLKQYAIFLIIGVIAFIVLIVYLYKNIKIVRTVIQYIAMKTPVFGQTIIYNEVTMFTKTFASLLSHNVFITESMEVLNKITNNEIYKMLILDTMSNLAKGDRISDAFKDQWAFPLPAYEMLVTGEKTGELPEMMSKVSTYYQELHKQQVTRIKTFIEPILTVFLTVVVGIIILAIIIPMFGMYSTIQSY